MTRRQRPNISQKNTKPASERIFYRAPRKWVIWKVLMSGPAIAFYCMVALLTIALQYAP